VAFVPVSRRDDYRVNGPKPKYEVGT
jgi:hypothetical protein